MCVKSNENQKVNTLMSTHQHTLHGNIFVTTRTFIDHIWACNTGYIKQSGVVNAGINDYHMGFANHQKAEMKYLTIQ